MDSVLDPCSCFDAISACNRQTHRRTQDRSIYYITIVVRNAQSEKNQRGKTLKRSEKSMCRAGIGLL